MKSLAIPGGIMHMGESKAVCHFCQAAIGIDEVDGKLCKSKNGFIRHKCQSCKKFIGITLNYLGDIVSYQLGSYHSA